MNSLTLSYSARAKALKHPVAQQLLNLMANKKTNLALSADVTHKKDLLALAEKLGPHICILKTHIDILVDFDQDLIDQLTEIAQEQQFLLFEDRKFADIGHTVQQQYQGGIYKIVEWADIINAHSLPGPSIIEGLKTAGSMKQRACLLLAQMSSADNLFSAEYVQHTLELAKEHADFVIGFIAQQRLLKEPDFIYLTPGVNLASKNDNLGQSYSDPEYLITKAGSDVIIVGRGIYQEKDPVAKALEYRQKGWEAYEKRLKNI